jgi:hypothetical protein
VLWFYAGNNNFQNFPQQAGNGRPPQRGGFRGGHNNQQRGGYRGRGQQSNQGQRTWSNDSTDQNTGAPPSNRGGGAKNNNRKFSHGKGRGGN